MQKIDEKFMRRALELSLKGRGCVHPNPMVGAVLVRRGRILAEGFHARFGGPHAEIEALKKFKTAPSGSTLYVTLEPCSHTGKTQPCVETLISKKVRRVVMGARDVNPLVSGNGIRALRQAGIQVVVGVCGQEAAAYNRDFNYWIRNHTPYVTVKAGQSMDGAIAAVSGESQWITSKASRQAAMELRGHSDAILVGASTILSDNPRLSVRLAGFRGKGPLKVVLDPHLRTPRTAKIFSDGASLLIVSSKVSQAKRRVFAGRAEVLGIPVDRSGRFDWKKLLAVLGARGVVQVLIEGGGETIGSAFDAGIVNEAHFFLAPIVLGGSKAVRSVAGRGVSRLNKAPRFKHVSVERIGDDFHYTGIF